MCKDAIAMATDPKPKSQPRTPPSSTGKTTTATASSSFGTAADTSYTNPLSSSKPFSSPTSTSTSTYPFSGIKDSLPDNPTFYSISEILSATNYFLSGRLSASTTSSPSWRCTLRGKDSVIFQIKFREYPKRLRSCLASICKIYHGSIVRLLGASLDGDYVYLVYDYVPGSNLADCLRNPRNPHYTPLATWVSRMLVAKDLADCLAYIHCYAGGWTTPYSDHHRALGTVHNRIKSSSVIITDPHLRPKICHIGAAVISGEAPDEEMVEEENSKTGNTSSPATKNQRRLGSFETKIEGTRGYMAPEILTKGSISKKSDVFAFGVVLLELLSGQEPLKYTYDKGKNCYVSFSLVKTAQAAIGSEEEGGEERSFRIRQWVDRRLGDSFRVVVAERLLLLSLECVEAEAEKRPDMAWVAGKVSKMFLQSEKWAEKSKISTDITGSMAPR